MPNNIKALAPNAIVAKATIDFVTAGIDSTNTEIIYLVDDPLKSYVPGRAINGITGFVADQGYYLVAKTAIDLTACVVPPVGGGVVTPALATPTALTATAGDGSLLLDWNDVPNATGYVVTRATDPGFTANVSNTTIGSPTSQATLSGLTNGTVYYIRVKATAAGYTDSLWATAQGTPAASGGGSYDAEAQTYFTAFEAGGGTYNSTQKGHINTFIAGLKTDAIYSKIRAMWFLFGGNSTNAKWNVKNPLNTNAAHRLTFTGGFTFENSGATADGADGTYADTYINPSALGISMNSFSMGAFAVTDVVDSTKERSIIGHSDTGNQTFITPNYLGNRWAGIANVASISAQGGINGGAGFHISSRTSNSLMRSFLDGVKYGGDVTESAAGSLNFNLSLFNLNSPNQSSYIKCTDQKLAFAFVGDGLTDSDVSSFTTRVNTLLTGLSII